MARADADTDAVLDRICAAQARRLADFAASLLQAGEGLGIQNKVLLPFPLDKTERRVLAELEGLPDPLRKKLAHGAVRFRLTEVVRMVTAVVDSFQAVEPDRQRVLLAAAASLVYCVHRDILTPAWRREARKQKPTLWLYQFRITLLDTNPAIWRRIQIHDCTLDRLHELIQTSMGWTNSHLHRFEINRQVYADPQLMEEDFHESNCRDSTITLLSEILPADQRRFGFDYCYDFGDSWRHEVLFEGCPDPTMGQDYPVCLEGERACPPEDVGGVFGYAEFVKTISNRDHDEREETLEWADGWFDPDEFDAATATKYMRKGILDWRVLERQAGCSGP